MIIKMEVCCLGDRLAFLFLIAMQEEFMTLLSWEQPFPSRRAGWGQSTDLSPGGRQFLW